MTLLGRLSNGGRGRGRTRTAESDSLREPENHCGPANHCGPSNCQEPKSHPEPKSRSEPHSHSESQSHGEPRRRKGPDPRAWAELLRLPALFTVPGDALAGAAAAGARPNGRTLLAVGSSLCLYEAGMALNDWADRAEDARDRPHRPLPSGRVRPVSALAAAGALTAAGLALAARAGRPGLTVAVPLAATVWSYDLALKHTRVGPAAMAAARGLDLLLGSATTTGTVRPALGPALALGAHTLAVTTVSRRETQGGSSAAPLGSLLTTAALSWALTRRHGTGTADTEGAARTNSRATAPVTALFAMPATALTTVLTATYTAATARPYVHAALNPSPPLTQRAVGAGIRAMIPLQAALTARAGAPGTALLTAALAPAARRFARKVSVT
ncbi:SCO3242 family prenyltransferase [Streptomyces sp. CRN 30]|uniref:SCO3242 family prenyltransferase n=1 Tax=Streptomyces sp. CRN 30 TaxID=3075613 RepID=UPI002A8088F6|nr:UbiA family prenyltransferase [Streptomyces sp. CRN 30]